MAIATATSAKLLCSGVLLAFLQTSECLRNFGRGVLVVQDTAKVHEELFCVRDFPKIHNFTTKRDQVRFYPLSSVAYFGDNDQTCEDDAFPDITGKFAFVHAYAERGDRQNCSLVERASVIQDHNGVGMLANSSIAFYRTEEVKKSLTIAVAAMLDPQDMAKLLKVKAESPDWEFGIYTPVRLHNTLDPSLLVILLMAVTTIGVGSLWSGEVKHRLRIQLWRRQAVEAREEAGNDVETPEPSEGRIRTPDAEPKRDEDNVRQPVDFGSGVSMQISSVNVFFYVLLICAMLVLLYFFFSYLVYVVIALFCLGSTIAVYSCFEPFVTWTQQSLPCPTFVLPRCNLCLCVFNMELRQFLLLIVAVAVTVVWVVFRNSDWAWILQDFLSILFSINTLKLVRLPSLKMCTLLLSALFVYDIFFVFVTPFFTKDGKSIMEEVATGGETGEQIPVLIKVPQLNPIIQLKVCGIIPYSMLGLGDILVPGLLLSYCLYYDLYAKTPFRLYWVISNISYCLGLVAAFVSLYLMERAQPALLYLVPFTLLPVTIVALIRGEFFVMWRGDFENKPESPINTTTTSTGSREEIFNPADQVGQVDSIEEPSINAIAASPGSR